jgi:two-component system LytT family response regulator
MGKYNVMVIDDNLLEALALKKMLSSYCININKIDCFFSIEEGVVAIREDKPDIVFLDVMFEESVIFDFLHLFELQGVAVVFVSSEGGYAVNAFQNNGVDFILKPFRIENVITAMNKAVKRNEIDSCCALNDCPGKILQNSNSNYIAVPSLERIEFLKMEDVVFCMAEGKYTVLSLINGKKIVSSKNLGEYEKLLNNSFFYRIHHGYIINIKHLVGIVKKDGLYCELSNRMTIPVSKRRQESFNKFIRLKN